MSTTATFALPEFRAAGTDLSERRRTGVSKGPVVDLVLPGDDGIIWSADGAGLLEARHITTDLGHVGTGPLLVGAVVAFLSGVWAIRWLVALLAAGRFHRFAPYCFAIGAFTLGVAVWRG